MSISVGRTRDGWWVLRGEEALRVDTEAVTTAQLLGDRAAVEATLAKEADVRADSLSLVSPVTAPCRVVSVMTNYRSQARHTGQDLASSRLAFFRKASESITGPRGVVLRPEHVRRLDYQGGIGMVIGRRIAVGTQLDSANLADHVAGLVIANDLSARDIHQATTQAYESNSYPTFTPVGPVLVLLDGEELLWFYQLHLRLWVNDELRQESSVAGDMMVGPLQLLQALTRFQSLDPGDLVITGTPAGTALASRRTRSALLAALVPGGLCRRRRIAVTGDDAYLQDGDVIEIAIASDDGVLDLGRQRTTVRDAA